MKKIELGSMELVKGDVRDGHQLIAWDAIQDCAASECPLFNQCKYVKKGVCSVQLRYVETIVKTVVGNFKYLDDMQLMKVGMHLVPLYSMLARLKIVERSVSASNVVQVTPRGMFIHPIFNEIRKTIVVISTVWKELMIKPVYPEFPDPEHPEKTPAENDPRIIHGDPEYYKRLTEKPELKRKGVIR
jgi:hypothetical protein